LRPSSATCSLSSRIRLSLADNKSLPGQRKSTVGRPYKLCESFHYISYDSPYKWCTRSATPRSKDTQSRQLPASLIVRSRFAITSISKNSNLKKSKRQQQLCKGTCAEPICI
jgi:hypothetical protein